MRELIDRYPDSDFAIEALIQMIKSPNISEFFLQDLPKRLLEKVPDFQAYKLKSKGISDVQTFFNRWPHHPSTWQLQWELAREALLSKRWKEVESIFSLVPAEHMPGPFAARRQFWEGFVAHKQEKTIKATRNK